MARALCDSVSAKIDEQIERLGRLIDLVPAERLEWRPGYAGAWRVDELLGHLLDCLAGFCAVLAAVEPERLAHFERLRMLPVNRACSPGDALERVAVYRAHIGEGLGLLADADLATPVPTVFVKQGEAALTLLLGNLEHLINHKHQLFTYLKEMGVAVGTADLYCFRS
jgi:hypothetical protein